MTASNPTQPILGVRASDIADCALVVGDPDRAAHVAASLDGVREVGRSREYITLTGTFRGTGVTIASHGVGAAGAAICFEELARAGVQRIVRAGTCGGLQPEVTAGDLIIGTAAVRDDGVTDRLLAIEWPAAADADLTGALREIATSTAHRTHVGVVHTAANFYPDTLATEPRWRYHHRAGAIAIEMEFAALLVVAQLHGQAAGGIFAADGNLLTADADMADYTPDREEVARAKRAMIDVGLRALVADAR